MVIEGANLLPHLMAEQISDSRHQRDDPVLSDGWVAQRIGRRPETRRHLLGKSHCHNGADESAGDIERNN